MMNIQRHAPKNLSAGFTLLEMLVVLVIIGLLAGLVGPQLLGRVDTSKVIAADTQIRMLKAAIETSGYKTRKDTEGVIRALEGLQMKSSIGHPQGNKILRKEDHAGLVDCYISRIEKGRFEVKKKIAKEDLAKNMPVRHDLSKMPV